MFKIVLVEDDEVQQYIAKSVQLHRTYINKDCQATCTTIKCKCDKWQVKSGQINPEFQNVTKSAGRDENM